MMKKTLLSLLVALAVSFSAIGTVTAFAGADDVPEPIALTNVALNKEASFRSFDDMSKTLEWSAYSLFEAPYLVGQEGYSMLSLTDGAAAWGNTQNRAPATANTSAWVFLDLEKEYLIDNIKVGYLSAWVFTDVVIQVSNDPTFATGVTTIFATNNIEGVYEGGQVGCNAETKAATGWNGFKGVDSLPEACRTYAADFVSARYVRLTNTDNGNGGAVGVTTITELQVYAVTSGLLAPTASVPAGTFYAPIKALELSTVYNNAEIYYTLDGSYPTENSTKYTGALDLSAIDGAFTLRAITVVDGKQSEAADYAYIPSTNSGNIAVGKEVSFRDINDVTKEVAWSAYFPDNQGFYGRDGYSLSSLTDGTAAWGVAQNRSAATAGTMAWVFLDLGQEWSIENVKVGYLAAWCFRNVVIQVSNDPTFATGVTTIFATNDIEGVYEGGQVGCNAETQAATGWNGFAGVDSLGDACRTYAADGVSARYVRVTNSDEGNGGAQGVTTITELQVYTKPIIAPSNIAAGKEVSFRNINDVTEEVAWSAYFPDNQGFYGQEGYSLLSLTDGTAAWGVAQNRSTATAGTMAWVYLDLGKEYKIAEIKVGYLASWGFSNVVIQVSDTPDFSSGVTTIFAINDIEGIYNGGQIGCSSETKDATGWNEGACVNSLPDTCRTYAANGVYARYVRLTNSDEGNGGAQGVTTITELQVYEDISDKLKTSVRDTVKTASEVKAEMGVAPGTDADGVKAALPEKVIYTTMNGASGEIALDWTSADWQEMTEGEFTFTANTEVSVDDVFDVIPETYTVTVTVKKADTSALDAVIAEVDALDNTIYTKKTWSPLAALVAEAKQAIAPITVTEETISSYRAAIEESKAALKLLATDKTALESAVTAANAVVKANYMSASLEGFDGALETAKTVNADEDASEEEVTAATNALNVVLNGLVEKGDLTALTALVNEIKAKEYAEENYEALSFATFADALAAAEKILAAEETPKTNVDAAYTALDTAYKGLVEYGDSEQLETLIEECEELKEEDYTVGTWADFATKLQNAKDVVATKHVQADYDEAEEGLKGAKNGLVSVVALKAAIAETIDETAYTAISVQLYKDALAEAQLVLDNDAATADEIAAAVNKIEEAKAALEEIEIEDESGSESGSDPENESESGETPDDGESGKKDSFGCGGSLGGLGGLTLASVLSLAVVAFKKKRR
ncbi:MAG: FIVAR domain-containing protein [Clostridia bacterium]|nr:FIVAR domain-containing protein [Clostridia bacterium]